MGQLMERKHRDGKMRPRGDKERRGRTKKTKKQISQYFVLMSRQLMFAGEQNLCQSL